MLIINEIQTMENAATASSLSSQSIRHKILEYIVDLNNYKLSEPLIYLLIIIQSIQIISMVTVTPLEFNSLGLGQFRMITKVLNPEYYFRESYVILVVQPLLFLIAFFHIVLLLLTMNIQSRLKIIVYYLFVVLGTVGTLPMLITNLSVMVCQGDSPFSQYFSCFEGIHILYLVLALLSLAWNVICIIILFLFFIDVNPFNRNYFSASSNWWILCKFLIKAVPAVFLAADPNLVYDRLYDVICVGLVLSYFGIFRFMWPFYRKCPRIEKFQIRCQVVHILLTVFFLILFFFAFEDTQNVTFLLTLLIGLVTGQFWIGFLEYNKQKLLDIFIEEGDEQPTQQQYIEFFNDFIYKIQQKQQIKSLQIFHIIKIHQLQCKKQEQCPCRKLTNVLIKETDDEQLRQNIYAFINMMINQVIEKIKGNNFSLRIMSSFIMFYKLKYKIKAVYLLLDLLKNEKIGLKEEISIYHLCLKLRKEDTALTELKKYRDFSEKLWTLEKKAESAVVHCKRYWKQLIQQDCQPTKIWKIANILNKDKEDIDYLVNKELLKIFPNNIQTLKIYIQVLTNIYRVPSNKIEKYFTSLESTIAMEEQDQSEQNTDKNIFKNNSDIVVMFVAEIGEAFEFTRVGSNVSRLLFVKNSDLVGKNINEIIPEIFHQFHDKKVKEYLLKSDQNIKQRNSNIFLKDSRGNMLKCSYKAKLLPVVELGLEFVCFFKKIEEKNKKKRYISYYFEEITHEEKDKSYKTGDVLHIDPELKEYFYGCEKDEFNNNEDYEMAIQDILPCQDLYGDDIMIEDKNDETLDIFSCIKIEHQVQLQAGIFIKYIQFTYKANKESRISMTVDAFRQSSPLLKKSTQDLRASFYPENSLTRLHLFEDNNQQQTHSQRFQSKYLLRVPIKVIAFSVFLSFIILFATSLVIFKQAYQKKTIEAKDFNTVRLTHNISIKLFEASLKIQQSLHPNDTSFINQGQINVILNELNQLTDQLYQLIGFQKIDEQIVIIIYLIKSFNTIITEKSTLNNAISYFISKISEIHKGDTGSYQVIVKSLENIYEESLKVNHISNNIVVSFVKKLKSKQYIIDGTQEGVVFVLVAFFIYRTWKISKFSQSTIEIYQNEIDIPQMLEFNKKCDTFLENLKAVPQTEDQQEHQKNARSIIFHLEYLAFPKLNKQKTQHQQSTKLLEMKKQITFQPRPSKYVYIIIAIILFSAWTMVKTGVKYFQSDLSEEEARIKSRQRVTDEFLLSTRLQRLLYYLSVSERTQKSLNKSLTSVEKVLMKLNSQYSKFKDKTNVSQLFKILLLLRTSQQNIPYSTIFNQINLRRSEIVNLAETDINEQLSNIISNKYVTVLAIQIILAIIVMFGLWKLMSFQQEIRIGCTLMIDILGQQQLKLKCRNTEKEKSVLFSPFQNI